MYMKDSIFPQIVPTGTINLSLEGGWTLFLGGVTHSHTAWQSKMEVQSIVRGHHVTGEELTVIPEDNNDHDSHAVAVMKDSEVIGHVPLQSRLTCNMWANYSNYHITCGGCRYYSRADTISLNKGNHADTVREWVLFDVGI